MSSLEHEKSIDEIDQEHCVHHELATVNRETVPLFTIDKFDYNARQLWTSLLLTSLNSWLYIPAITKALTHTNKLLKHGYNAPSAQLPLHRDVVGELTARRLDSISNFEYPA